MSANHVFSYCVIQNDQVVFKCNHILAGLGFIAGRGAGVLCKVLCDSVSGFDASKPEETEKPKKKREKHTSHGGD